MDLSPGDRVDRYVLCEPLGEGGQGAVWKAQDPLAGDAFRAIKLVSVAGTRPNDTERLRREARSLARLSHTSLLKSHALFEDLPSGVLGIVMDYVEGTSLRAAQGDPRFSAELGAHTLGHIARALAYVHEAGVTHRDLKLENVLVTSQFWSAPDNPANTKLVDFGIAKETSAAHGLTAIDTVVGTLAYLAPELIDPGYFAGQTSAPAVDVFAFGVLGYKLLVGPHPSGLPVTASIVDYAAVYRHRAQDGAIWPPRIGQGAWAELLIECLRLQQNARLRDGKALVDRIERIPTGVASLAGAWTAEAPAPMPTSIASPHAALAPTEALVAIPGRPEPIPLAPSVSTSVSGQRRDAPTAPLRAVPSTPTAAPTPSSIESVPAPLDISQPVEVSAPQAQTTARAVSVSERAEPAPSPRWGTPSAIVWAAAGTLASIAAVIGYRFLPWSSWFSGDDRAPEPIVLSPTTPTASPTPIAPVDKPELKPDAARDSGPARSVPSDCDAGTDTAGCPCCPAGRDCGGSCDAPLAPDGHWLLRLGRADKAGKTVPGTRVKVCVRIDAVGKQAVCTRVSDTLDGSGVPQEALEITGEDFERSGLDVTLLDLPDAGTAPPPQVSVPRHSLLKRAVCKGLEVDTSKVSQDIDHVVFYLDNPGTIPHRCNLP